MSIPFLTVLPTKVSSCSRCVTLVPVSREQCLAAMCWGGGSALSAFLAAFWGWWCLPLSPGWAHAPPCQPNTACGSHQHHLYWSGKTDLLVWVFFLFWPQQFNLLMYLFGLAFVEGCAPEHSLKSAVVLFLSLSHVLMLLTAPKPSQGLGKTQGLNLQGQEQIISSSTQRPVQRFYLPLLMTHRREQSPASSLTARCFCTNSSNQQ